MNITDAFIDYLYKMACSPIPVNVKAKANQALLDYIGVTYGGAYADGNSLDVYLTALNGCCSVLGSGGIKVDAARAAFINGFHAHSLEMDDGHRFGMLHPGATVISAVLAISEQEKLSFDQMQKGIVLGYEAAVKLAICLQPGHKMLGYHTTGTCGTVGAAIGCAVAMEMNREQLKAVLSAAATCASGVLKIQEDASQLKAYNVAHASMEGVMAAMIGRTGLRGSDDILGGDRGFLQIHSTTVDFEKLILEESYYEIQRIYVKPYAACRHCHSALEAVMKVKHLFKTSGYIPEADNIEEIRIDTYLLAICGHDHTKIRGIQSAKMSMPYSVAAAYFLDGCGVDAFSIKRITDNDILELVKKVVIFENPEFTALSPEKRIAEVIIRTKQGERKSYRVDYAKGEPENPMTNEEIQTKFVGLMSWCGQRERAQRISELFSGLEISSGQLFNII